VLERKPEREDERHPHCEKRLAVSQQLNVRRFVLKIDHDGRVFSQCLATVPMDYPSVVRSRELIGHEKGNSRTSQDHREGCRAVPRQAMDGSSSLMRHARAVARLCGVVLLPDGHPQ